MIRSSDSAARDVIRALFRAPLRTRSRLPSALGILTALLALTVAAPAPEAAAQEGGEHEVFEPSLFDELEYRMIGPYRGGRSTAVAGIPQAPHTFFMGVTGGGVWITEDDGESWEPVSDEDFQVGSIGSIDVADADPSVVYVGTGSADIRGNVSTGKGVYRSLDGGEGWEMVGLEDAGNIGDIEVHPRDPETVFAAAMGHPFGKNQERGVFRSTDGGDTWEKVLFLNDSTGAQSLAINPRNPREIYAGMWRAERKPWAVISGAEMPSGGIWKSSDGGDTWERLENGLPDGLVGKTSVAVSPADPDRVWALLEAPGDAEGLYRSDDGGESWRQINTENHLTQRAFYYIHVRADPRDPNTVYILNTGLYRSVDGGRTFEGISVPHGDVHDLWIHPDDTDHMVVANDGGAQVSVNGGESWTTYYNQPTAELYSITVDEQFPYRVYAPQQDNSTISLPAWNGGGTHPKQFWYSVGGCETGPIAIPDPETANTIYAGCYGGVIDRVDLEDDASRNMLIYPQLQLGQAPRDLKYRFQWNAPIVASPHNTTEIYHASQHVHRTTDGGMTWETVSPDLTTDTEAHQECGGYPITCEDTGVEVFNTVFSLRISPHSNDVIWAGTDDGRVWISRDHGGEWTEITPPDMPEFGTVDAIDPSPHEPGTAYVAVHRYRMDDWTPYIWKTTDYGGSWTRIADGTRGIDPEHTVRVVREDPDRQGLLYAGTEFGVYVSFDDGGNWQPFRQNLPVVPIQDLKVHRQDLIVATKGRSLWIMDDLTPLHQLSDRVASADVHLFEPRHAYRMDTGYGGFGRWPESRPEGAVVRYTLAQEPEDALTVEFLDDDGEVVRGYGEGYDDGAPSDTGMNQLIWNLATPGVDDVDDAVVWGYTGGVQVVPGRYTVRLTADGETREQPLEVRLDPRREDDVTPQELAEQYDLATTVRDSLQSVYDAVRTVRSVREQVRSVAKSAVEAGHDAALESAADSIAERLTDLEGELLQTKAESGQDVINYPPQLDNQYASLYGYVAGPDGAPTAGAYTRLEDLNGEWSALRDRLGAIMEDVSAFNDRLEEEGIRPVMAPSASGSSGGGS